MRKAKLIVMYEKIRTINNEKRYYIYNANIINRHGEIVSLLNGSKNLYTFTNMTDVISTLVSLAKARNYTIDTFKDFGCLWYDISFINRIDGTTTKYPYKVIKER